MAGVESAVESAAIQGIGALLAIPTFGASEGVAQGVQAAKLVSVGKKVLTIVNAMRVSVAGVVISKAFPLLKSVVKFRSVRKGKVVTKTAKKPKRKRNKNGHNVPDSEKERFKEHAFRERTPTDKRLNKDHRWDDGLKNKGGNTLENQEKITNEMLKKVTDKYEDTGKLNPANTKHPNEAFNSETKQGRFQETVEVETTTGDKIKVTINGTVDNNGNIRPSTAFIIKKDIS